MAGFTPDQAHIPTKKPDLPNTREASRAPSERSTHFDISEHDFLSVRGPPSQPSTMGTDIGVAGRGGGAPREKRTHKKLILCFDGTGNKFHGDDSDSNILKIFRMLDRTANDQFLAEMLDYVGLLSHGNEEMVAFAWKAFSQWQCRRSASSSDEAGQRKKREMYAFLKGFRETFSRPVRRIRFLGLFDTVNSVPRFETAWMERSKFPYTARSSARRIRHAVSIDERRAKFRQDLMYQSHDKEAQHHHRHHNSIQVGNMMHDIHEKYRRRPSAAAGAEAPTSRKKETAQTEDRGRQAPKDGKLTLPMPDEEGGPAPYRAHSRSKSRHTCKTADTASNYSMIAPYDDGDSDEFESDEDEAEQDIDEVWFAGGHGDVGGGWPVDGDNKSTSHVPLVWMVREAINAGLSFDIDKVVAMGCSAALGSPTTTSVPGPPQGTVPDIHVDASSPPFTPMIDEGGPNEKSRQSSTTETGDDHPQSKAHEMLHKAHVARIHDSLSYDCGMSFMSVFSWKLMEYMPFRRMDLQRDGSWKPIRWPLPCGEVRDVPDNVRVHGSVIRRMQQDKMYRPGNLIVGGGGRGCRVAPESHGMGEWECVANPGDPVSEIWKKRTDDSPKGGKK
ncbi:hypothetical protein N0V82_004075 [Gnomoniopsis sp. IMI 355080]|nr:hypothetical protein N0V82_004075 [Gnomoniopsis sp. IMI 355080]